MTRRRGHPITEPVNLDMERFRIHLPPWLACGRREEEQKALFPSVPSAPRADAERVRKHMMQQLIKRMGSDPARPLYLRLDERMLLYRPREGRRDRRIRDGWLENTDAFEIVSSHDREVAMAMGKALLETQSIAQRWGQTLMVFAAVRATLDAELLLRQLGSRDAAKYHRSRLPADFEKQNAVCVNDAYTCLSLREAPKDLYAALIGPTASGGEQPAILSFALTRGEICVTRLSSDGRALSSQSFDSFFSSACSSLVEKATGQITDLLRKEKECRKAALRMLQKINRRVAWAACRCMEGSNTIGLRLGRGKLPRGTPVEAWLTLDGGVPFRSSDKTRAVLSLRRGHDEFVMERSPSEKGPKWFYIPPCLIVGRLTYSGLGQVEVGRTLVRTPGGSPVFVHPYTGKPGRWQYALLIDDEASLCPEPSQEAYKLISNLSSDVSPEAQVGDMCLPGQDELARDQNLRIETACRKGAEPDLLEILSELMNHLRLGLTHGHQVNRRDPRMKLTDTLYPLQNWRPSGRLAKRLFPYDPQVGG